MIIGITGTLGAGKGAVVSYLISQRGFAHYSARTFFAKEMERQGLYISRDTMTAFANALREAHGPRYLFEQLFAEARTHGGDAVIESIRTVGEAEALKEQEGFLLAVDATQALRYERIHGRGSVLDQVTWEEFQAQEAREMHSDDPHKQNISAVMKMADALILNNGTREELEREIECVMALK